MSARELYVYYRVPCADAVRCEAVVRDFQARLRHDEPRLQTRWLTRSGMSGDETTWMETYALDGAPADGIDLALQARIEAAATAALAPYLRGPRHVEVFIRRS